MILVKTTLLSLLLIVSQLSIAEEKVDSLKESRSKVNDASQLTSQFWKGPTSGPKAAPDKNIIFVAADLRNDSIKSLAHGVIDAIDSIGWNVRFLDGQGSENGQASMLTKAISGKPDGIILGGVDIGQRKELLQAAKKLNIPIVGWHVGPEAGSSPDSMIFYNVSTKPVEVAELAAHYAIIDGNGQSNVVIFTDTNFSVAKTKSDTIIHTIEEYCSKCNILSVEDISITAIPQQMPLTIERLIKDYKNQITHFIVINDLYIDFALPSLLSSKLAAQYIPRSISAGDGSKMAYKRISSNTLQVATVPEPLTLQGWQIVDELNRAFNQNEPSGYIEKAQIINRQNIKQYVDKSNNYDPDQQYRKAYLQLWH
jgi:ribose transport system substrate-binding protein